MAAAPCFVSGSNCCCCASSFPSNLRLFPSFRPPASLRIRPPSFSDALRCVASPRVKKLDSARAQFAEGEIHSPPDASENHLINNGENSGEGQQHGFRTPPDGPRLYVGNLPWACTSDDLAQHFQGAGTVELVEVMYDRETGRSRGFAFVTMDSMDAANAAVSRFDGVEFMGRRIRVSFPDRSRSEGPFSSSSSFSNYSSNVNKLFVGNLPWGMDDVTLENIFSEHGKVIEARVVYDRESGRSRGFGFVTLSSADEVNEAISKLDGAEVQGRPLRVNLASDRPPSRQSFF